MDWKKELKNLIVSNIYGKFVFQMIGVEEFKIKEIDFGVKNDRFN